MLQKIVLTVKDVAEILNVDVPTVLELVTSGALPGFQIREDWRIRREDLEGWMADQVLATRQLLAPKPARKVTGQNKRTPVFNDESAKEKVMSDSHLSDLTERVPQEELHRRFAEALGGNVLAYETFDKKPFELDLKAPLPQRVRVYMYNATRPPGGRPLGEHKVQLIVPGQGRTDRGAFDSSGGRIVLLVGYAAEEDVFVLWDAGLYPDFAWSRNVQVKGHTIIDATAGKIATQERQLRPSSGRSIVETVVAVKRRNLAEGIERRMELTRQRLLRD